jgi:chromosomal replication initiator protein
VSNWQRCLDLLEGELPAQQYNTWIRPLQSVEEGHAIRLLAPNAFVLDWVQKNYLKRFHELTSQVWNGNAPEIRLEIGSVASADRLNMPTA